MKVQLPNNWTPRHYQAELWNELGSDKKRFLSIWHRRSGKDDTYLHHNACAAWERIGNYWYMLPEYNQCRKAVWDAINPHTGLKRIDEAFPEVLRANVNNQEMKITFKNGSTFQLMGSDNYNSLVGSPPVGLTFSEYALSNPTSWGFLRPILLENGGWAAFNSTPRGKNHLAKLLKLANQSDDWFVQILTVDDTGIFSKEQLAAELEELIIEHDEEYGRALFMQEYYCSFDAALPGAIWGDSTTRLEQDGRLCHVPHTKGHPVHSAWDLGMDDDTAIWFYQVVTGEIRVIDYYENNFKDPDFYAEYLRELGNKREFRYGTHWLPHDAKPRRMGMGGKTVIQQFIDHARQIEDENHYRIGKFSITPSFSKEDGIQAARKTFKMASFDKTHCEMGFEHLKAYRRKYDEDAKTFSKEPIHDFNSHASDAWRYLSLTWKKSKETQIVVSPEQKLYDGNITHINFGALKKEHFKKKRQERNRLWR